MGIATKLELLALLESLCERIPSLFKHFDLLTQTDELCEMVYLVFKGAADEAGDQNVPAHLLLIKVQLLQISVYFEQCFNRGAR